MRSTAIALLAVVLCISGCQNPPPVESTSTPKVEYVDWKTSASVISGYVWDPEAFWFALAMCPSPCMLPPITIPETPFIERSEVIGASVRLVDTRTGAPFMNALAATDRNGGYQFVNVPERSAGPPYLVFAAPPPPSVTPLKDFGPPAAPIPAAGYLPSLAMKPIYNRFTDCIGQSIMLASTGGVLDAVAKYLTPTGGPAVAVTDFIDPSKYGGALVAWFYAPEAPVVRVPAGGTRLTAPGMTVYNITWAPPGLGPTGLQSPRGFFVTTSPSPIGVVVALAPRLMGAPAPVQLTFQSSVTFPALPPIVTPPGLISTLEMQALVPGGAPPPEYICINPG